MNNVRLQNSSTTSGLQENSNSKSNSKTGSITNISTVETNNPLLEQNFNKKLEELREQQELKKRMMLKKFQEEQQYLLEQHKKMQEKIRAIQTKDFSSKIIEEEHRQDETQEKEDNLSSSIASFDVRKRLKDKLISRKNGAITGNQQPNLNTPVNW